MVACGCLWLLGLSGCLSLPVVASVDTDTYTYVQKYADPDAADDTDINSDTEALSGGWNAACVFARMHEPADHIQQLAMCLFCLKLAEPLVVEGSSHPIRACLRRPCETMRGSSGSGGPARSGAGRAAPGKGSRQVEAGNRRGAKPP